MSEEQQRMLTDLLDLEDGLNDWEVEFVEDLSHRPPDRDLSDKQADKLQQIYNEHC